MLFNLSAKTMSFQSLISRIGQTKLINYVENRCVRLCSTGINSDKKEIDTGICLTPEIIDKIAKGNQDSIKKLKLIEFECSVKQQEGLPVPSRLTLTHWEHLFALPSSRSREKQFHFLHRVEMIKKNEERKKLEKRKKREESMALKTPEEPDDNQYGLGKNAIFIRTYNSTIDHFNNMKCIRALMFENPVIFDMGFNDTMSRMEQNNTAKQIMLTFGRNREHDQPFPLHLCNADPESQVMKELHKYIPPLYQPEFPMTVTHKNYLDIFPREKLVYLTPHCNTELTSYDPEAIYIIGGIVDKSNKEPLTWAKASREKIKMAKLPLDRYLKWGSGGGKSLTLNSMIEIMLELKTSGNWKKALEVVPQRKLKTFPERSRQLKNQLRNSYSESKIDLQELLFESNRSKEPRNHIRKKVD